jgi:Fic family protein
MVVDLRDRMKMLRTPPDFRELLASAVGSDRIEQIINGRPVDHEGRYLHWDDMRNRTPPEGMTHEQWWLGTALSRRTVSRPLPLLGTNGQPFRFSNVDPVQEVVHRIDQQASGQILADDVVMSLRSSDRYLVSSLVEEAITSSQLEGASTTRRVAKELLATGRPPRDRSEQMIVNNYQAMLFAQDAASSPLTPADVLSLHRIVTEDTLDDPKDAGRLQAPGEKRIAVYWTDDLLLHTPPPAEELPARLDAMCRFANGETGEGFVHPVVRAIIVHFWLAYDHPFVDGNGRTARALFYWLMLRSGYWLTQYLSVSSILRKAPAQYAKSFLQAETDDNDITYFVVYQLGVIERAIASLHEYLARKIVEIREIDSLLHGSSRLNHRQLVVVRDALRDPSEPFTISAQARRNRVTYESARSDLLDLERMGLFEKERVGKKYVFRPCSDLERRLRELGSKKSGGLTARATGPRS